jgi:hypothetical protein
MRRSSFWGRVDSSSRYSSFVTGSTIEKISTVMPRNSWPERISAFTVEISECS